MSKAYHFSKNFNWGEMANLIRYEVKDPSVLTHKQKLTRLYRSALRVCYKQGVNERLGNFEKFMNMATVCRLEFQDMMEEPTDSKNLGLSVKKWELWVDDHYDADDIISESRPYAAASLRYYTFDNTLLSYDPIGYYKPRLLGGNIPDSESPVYICDYPMTDDTWEKDVDY